MIVDFKERTYGDGEQFYILILQGGVEMVKWKDTGKFPLCKSSHFKSSNFNNHYTLSSISVELQ
jgi:hypothetical protein